MKKQWISFNILLTFKVSFIGIVPEGGNFIFTLFDVILTSFHSSSKIYYKILGLNFTYSEVNFSIILNKCILLAVLHNFNGTNIVHKV